MSTLSTEVQPSAQISPAILEKALIGGDLAALTSSERLAYYRHVCQTVGLNPLTRPFDYIKNKQGKLFLYARKDAADQLRKLHGVSIQTRVDYASDCCLVYATATDASGRTDTDIGVVGIGNLAGDDLANAIMKAHTKAKRRVTLSICGLGFLDESEIETVPELQPDNNTRVLDARSELGLSKEEIVSLIQDNFGADKPSQLTVEECDRLIELMHSAAQIKTQSVSVEVAG